MKNEKPQNVRLRPDLRMQPPPYCQPPFNKGGGSIVHFGVKNFRRRFDKVLDDFDGSEWFKSAAGEKF